MPRGIGFLGFKASQMQGLSFAYRVWVLIGMLALILASSLFVGAIPQDPAYHIFADNRPWLGIANFGNVVSNLGFLVVCILGLGSVLGQEGQRTFDDRSDAWPYIVFFAGVGLVSAGSAYYHLAPDNARLFWDRLPMTLAFMAIFSAIVADRIHKAVGNRILLPVSIAIGVLSLFYWSWTESLGRGDLRLYGMVQFFPLLAVPVIFWLFPKGRYVDGRYLVWVILWYGAAKLMEFFDAGILDLLSESISGHSVKHLASAMAPLVVWRMLVKSRYG
jgi:ceramidase